MTAIKPLRSVFSWCVSIKLSWLAGTSSGCFSLLLPDDTLVSSILYEEGQYKQWVHITKLPGQTIDSFPSKHHTTCHLTPHHLGVFYLYGKHSMHYIDSHFCTHQQILKFLNFCTLLNLYVVTVTPLQYSDMPSNIDSFAREHTRVKVKWPNM